MGGPCRILQVVGARPNFMKIAPIARALARDAAVFSPMLVHTGQHYDRELSDVFFEQLGIPRPDINLHVGSGTQAQQTAAVMTGFDGVLDQASVDVVLVVGDVNSTLACALVAAKRGIPVAHVEAGLRSFDRSMPEEVNRVLTDHLSDWLFVSEPSGEINLRREGIAPERVHFVGNVMIDTLLHCRERARGLQVAERLGLASTPYAVLTLHRPQNVDQGETFEPIMRALEHVSRDVTIVFPVHPRTQPIVRRSPAAAAMLDAGRLQAVAPLGYLEFLSLIQDSQGVFTDSGGIQEETTVLGVPCFTLRPNTERPATVTDGTNHIVGTSTEAIVQTWERLRGAPRAATRPALWDGRAAERIVDVLRQHVMGGAAPHARASAGAAPVTTRSEILHG